MNASAPIAPASLFYGFAAGLTYSLGIARAHHRVYRLAEPEAVARLLFSAKLEPEGAQALALQIARRLRERMAFAGRAGFVQELQQEDAPSSQEGVALMHLAGDWAASNVAFEVALNQGSREGFLAASTRLAEREGPIVSLQRFADDGTEAPPEAVMLERAISNNTATAGGNASLMTIT